MDWKQMEAIFLQHNQHFELLSNINAIFEFFEDLYQKLKRCSSVTNCATLYPQAGPLLTAAATHPFLGYHKKLTQLVIDCILEYTKYDFSSTITSEQPLSKSAKWCLQRLKRIGSNSRITISNIPSIDHQIQKSISNIQNKLNNGPLTVSKVKRLCDLSTLLFNNHAIVPILDLLIDKLSELKKLQHEQQKENLTSLNENNNNHHQSIYSEKFIFYILNEVTNEHSLYHQWPIKLKTKLWDTIPDILEYEWMILLDNYLEKNDHQSNGLLDLQQRVTQDLQRLPLLQGLKHHPCLIHSSFDIITRLLLEKGLTDWRIITIWNKIFLWQYEKLKKNNHHHLQFIDKNIFIQMGFSDDQIILLLSFVELSSSTSVELLNDNNDSTHFPIQQLYNNILSFIYGGSSQLIQQRRNEAWLISMMYLDYIKKYIYLWIQWCTFEDQLWIDQMEHTSILLSWLVNPSLDNRMEKRHHILKNWILSLKGYNNNISKNIGLQTYLNEWMIMLNGNIQIGVYILIALIKLSNHWTVDECINIIQTFIYGSVTIKVTIFSQPNFYLLSILKEQVIGLKDSRKDEFLNYINDLFLLNNP